MSQDAHQSNLQSRIENLPFAGLAEEYGTPLYVYSRKRIEENCQRYLDAFRQSPDTLVCFAMKANANLALMTLMANMGIGADASTQGELAVAEAAGVPGDRIIFTGLGKSDADVARALDAKVLCFVVESFYELERIQRVASGRGEQAPITLRFNPNVKVETHPALATGKKESQFGFSHPQCLRAIRQTLDAPNLELVGLHIHVGSQLLTLAPFKESADLIRGLAEEAKDMGANVRMLDLGGGLGIGYRGTEEIVPLGEIASAFHSVLRDLNYRLLLEPGRSLIGDAGVFLTQVRSKKESDGKTFLILDGGMNDLLRPALYNAYHRVSAVLDSGQGTASYEVIGPVCECDDVFGTNRELPLTEPGDLLVIHDAGAYGYAMSSNYNGRYRPAEVLVDGSESYLIRERETTEDFLRKQRVPEGLKLTKA